MPPEWWIGLFQVLVTTLLIGVTVVYAFRVWSPETEWQSPEMAYTLAALVAGGTVATLVYHAATTRR